VATVDPLIIEFGADLGPLIRESKRAGATVDGFTRRIEDTARRTRGSYDRMTAASNNFSNSSRMLALQLSQVGQQTMASGHFMQALALQLPDIGLAFGTVGIAAGLLAGVTLPLLSSALGVGSEEAQKLAKAMETIAKKTKDANEAYRVFVRGLSSTEELRLVDAIADKQRELAEAQKQTINGMMLPGQKAHVELLKAERDELQKQLDTFREAEERRRHAVEDVKILTDQERMLGEQMQEAARQAALGATETERTRDAAAEAAAEFVKLVALATQFANEDLVMSMPVVAAKVPKNPFDTKTTGGRDTTRSDFERVQAQLATETETIMAAYAERQEALDAALERRLASEAEYKDLSIRNEKERNDALAAIAQKAEAERAGAYSDLFGALSEIAQTGGERNLKIAKAFGIAEALINTYQGATKALTLPFPQNLAAFAQTLATGLSAVQSIKGVSAGGGGSAAAASAAAPVAPPTQTVNVHAGNPFSEAVLRPFIEAVNEATRNGALVNARFA